MEAISWIYRRLTQNEFKAITDQIQSEGGGSQTYIDLPKGKISDQNLISFFGEGETFGTGYKWEVPIFSLGLDMVPQQIIISQRRESSNSIREQNKDKRINIWKPQYSDFPQSSYDEKNNPIYIFILKNDKGEFYAGWFYLNDYKENWFLTKDLCYPLMGTDAGYSRFKEPIVFDKREYNWPFLGLVSQGENSNKKLNETQQKIFYGAPGVGKSHNLKSICPNIDDVIRITFHPETDYASFVGCYKPIQKNKAIKVLSSNELINKAQQLKGKDVKNAVSKQVQFLFDNAESIIPAVKELGLQSVNQLIINKFGWSNETYFASILTSLLKERNNNDYGEIVYEFSPQAFTEVYIDAWGKYIQHKEQINNITATTNDSFTINENQVSKDVFLLIEEINRGNCAQIFGDMFQLLDRDEEGFSSYFIHPDKDLKLYLQSEFQKRNIVDELDNVKDGLGEGNIMLLPPNLHILATMNTSDQSLFPIDSAFKRRWEWVYMPIETKPKDKNKKPIERVIEVGNNLYDWSKFLENVNQKIYDITQSEDKQLGFWFVKPKNGNTISSKEFVSKVIFYLWNDIYKDFGDDASSIFNFSKDGNPNSNEKERHSFKQFTPHFQEIDLVMVDAFLKNLNLKPDSKKVGIATQIETETENVEMSNADNN